ncbi:MAG: hypothetical protein ACFFB6_12500 [Promethearchaeota archaeon]
MTMKKYLSNKKTAQQTISISPALKEWIKRYVNINKRKDPNDKRFKSISSFITYILDNIMKLFKEGKTIDDFKRVEDQVYKDFFDKFTFKATIPLYDMVAESNRYTPITFDFITRFIIAVYNFYRTIYLKERNHEGWRLLFERFKNRVYPSNITKELRLEIFTDENNKYGTAALEFVGKQRNLHFENCKFFAAICGMLGVKVTDFIYSPKDFYCRLDLVETQLVFREELVKKERLKLLKENVDFIVNYNRILDDKDKYLWMNLAEDNELFIGFKSKTAFKNWIKIIEEDLRKFGTQEDFLNKLLQFFNKLHWIRIENIKDLSFRIEQSIENNNEQKQFLIDYLSQHSEISQNNGIYCLK